MTKQAGTALTEYMLIGGLVSVAAIAGLALMGGNLGDGLKALIADMETSQSGSVAVGGGTTGGTPASAGNSTGNPANPGNAGADSGDSKIITLPDGTQIAMPSELSDWKLSVETTGANATTMAYLQLLEEVATKAVASGSLTPEEGNRLKALASVGYQMADIQKIVENNLPNNWQGKVSYNGRQYSLIELSQQIGYGAFGGGRNIFGSMSNNFNQLWQQAQSMPGMQDPSIRSLVNYSAGQVLNISNGVESTMVHMNQGDVRPSDYAQSVLKWAYEIDNLNGTNTTTPPSILTGAHSGNICAAGGGDCG